MVECKEALVMFFSTGISIGAFIDEEFLALVISSMGFSLPQARKTLEFKCLSGLY